MAKILIADDAAFMRMSITNALKVQGHEFLEAKDGLEAVSMFEAHMPDLMLLDITMPNLDGIGALKQVKSKFPAAKIMMCSAMGQEAMVVEAIKFGAIDFIVKPFKPDRIQQSVTKALGF